MACGIRTCALWIGLLLHGALASATETVPLYTYYATPPFAVEGLPAQASYTVRLAAWLTQYAAGRYRFEARQLPRLRLELMIAGNDWPGVVAWANPQWFADAEQRFLWSTALMQDSDLLVSRQAEPPVFSATGPTRALRFGGISGHQYAHLQPYIQQGLLQREDVQNDLSNLRKLQHGRVDVILLQASSLPYLRGQMSDFAQWARIDEHSQVHYARYLFTSRGNPRLLAFLNQALAAAPAWGEAFTPATQ